jgi:hypothetical protein
MASHFLECASAFSKIKFKIIKIGKANFSKKNNTNKCLAAIYFSSTHTRIHFHFYSFILPLFGQDSDNLPGEGLRS